MYSIRYIVRLLVRKYFTIGRVEYYYFYLKETAGTEPPEPEQLEKYYNTKLKDILREFTSKKMVAGYEDRDLYLANLKKDANLTYQDYCKISKDNRDKKNKVSTDRLNQNRGIQLQSQL